MKKSLNVLPILLIFMFNSFVSNNENISFSNKMLIIGVILIFTIFVIYKKIKNKELSKSSILIASSFILLSILIGIYTYYSI
jgi:amino acid transporter